MEQSIFEELFNCLKVLRDSAIDFPDYGFQKSYDVNRKSDNSHEFDLIINRKGHLRENTLTYVMISQSEGILVRLDFAGAPHADVPTPHVHIFDDEHEDGRIVVPLEEISNKEIVNELIDSLTEFLLYNNIEMYEIDVGLF